MLKSSQLEVAQPDKGFEDHSHVMLPQKQHSWESHSQLTVDNDHDSVAKATNQVRNGYVMKGQLEYDPNFKTSSDETFPVDLSEEEQVTINIVYPSREFQADNNEFKKRHESMQKDADEHYRLLVDL